MNSSVEGSSHGHQPLPISADQVVVGTALEVSLSDEMAANQTISFRLIEELGEGGMGIVYRAEQAFPRRTVALKIMKGNLTDSRARKRFAREIEIMARLNHPGIARLYSAGTL